MFTSNTELLHMELTLCATITSFQILKGAFTDSSTQLMTQICEYKQNKLIPKFQLIAILCLGVFHVYMYYIAQ